MPRRKSTREATGTDAVRYRRQQTTNARSSALSSSSSSSSSWFFPLQVPFLGPIRPDDVCALDTFFRVRKVGPFSLRRPTHPRAKPWRFRLVSEQSRRRGEERRRRVVAAAACHYNVTHPVYIDRVLDLLCGCWVEGKGIEAESPSLREETPIDEKKTQPGRNRQAQPTSVLCDNRKLS